MNDSLAELLLVFRPLLGLLGGGRGIGRRTALSFARFGANVVIAGRHPENLESTRLEIEALGVGCLAHPTNIRDLDQVYEADRAARSAVRTIFKNSESV